MPSSLRRRPVGVRRTITTTDFSMNTGVTTVSKSFQTGQPINVLYNQKAWSNTVDYRTRRKSGTLPDNDYLTTQTKLLASKYIGIRHEYPTASSSRITQYEWDYCHPSIRTQTAANGAEWPIEPSSLETSAIFDLLSKARSNQFIAPVFVAEGRKTVQMVRSRALTLVHAIRMVRKGNFKGFIESLSGVDYSDRRQQRYARKFRRDFGRDPGKAASNAWLEYSYGWVPFMNDVHAAMMTLMDAIELPIGRTGRVTSFRSSNQIRFYPDLLFETSPSVRNSYFFSSTWSRKMVWRFTTNRADLPAKFGLLNPATVAWELLPFSFVADWFVPIGDYLEALDSRYRFNHLGGSNGRRHYVTFSGDLTKSSYFNRQISGDWSGEYLFIRRGSFTSIPSVSLSRLGFDASLKSRQAISSLALLRQQLSRLK